MFRFPFRHGYYGSSGSSAPVKALTDLKLHLANSSHPTSSSSSSDMVVIHPGAVLAMLDLLPSVSSDSQPEVRKRGQEMCSKALPVKWVKGLQTKQESLFQWQSEPDSVVGVLCFKNV